MRAMVRPTSGARRRLLEAERRFFDAYSRGGDRDRRDLVIPIDFFARPWVASVLLEWARGAVLDIDAIEREWRRGDTRGDPTAFYRNLAHYVSLVR